tara:strand:+ start:471 stop:935 length:465 start_codon:yes stop_codon:yes gene_type:complete
MKHLTYILLLAFIAPFGCGKLAMDVQVGETNPSMCILNFDIWKRFDAETIKRETENAGCEVGDVIFGSGKNAVRNIAMVCDLSKSVFHDKESISCIFSGPREIRESLLTDAAREEKLQKLKEKYQNLDLDDIQDMSEDERRRRLDALREKYQRS